MYKILSLYLFMICAQLPSQCVAQSEDNPVTYLTAISNIQTEMNQKYLGYMSAVAHGRKARKVEKLRQQVINSIDDSRYKTIDLPIYKGDNSLRQSSIDYIKLCYNVFTEDYEKIVNMEDIAEQSYDEMQAFLLLKEKTNDKIDEAVNKMDEAGKAFAAKYNIQLIESKNEFDKMMEQAGDLNSYVNKVYLIFFKCYWQDGEIVKAMNKGKITEIEQGRASLIRFADEGLAALDTIKAFAGDISLVNTCKKVLQFYKKMAEKDIPQQSEYFLAKENFDKLSKSFEGKSQKELTKADVDAYNKSVKEINNASDRFNQVNNSINEGRNYQLKNWNEAEKTFNDEHMPYYK